MMKIAIILPSNIRYAPFYRKYEKILSENNVRFELIFWNRELIDEEVYGYKHPFDSKDRVNSGSYFKIIKYLKFASYVKKKLIKENYNKLIFLGSNACTVALLSSFLERNYKGNYWLDIRDYTYEFIKIYYNSMERAIKNSYATAISSEGYKSFLPKHKYILVHNIDSDSIRSSVELQLKKDKDYPIKISFIGLVRYYEENKKLLEALGNDERYIIQYYGQNSETLKKYCEENSIKNVDFFGRFNPIDTAKFYSRTDIINNIYGNSSVAVNTALSNKLYFAAALKIPILVSPETYMADITTKYNFGYPVNFNDRNLADNLFNWYELYKQQDGYGNTEYWNIAKNDNKIFEQKLMEYINS